MIEVWILIVSSLLTAAIIVYIMVRIIEVSVFGRTMEITEKELKDRLTYGKAIKNTDIVYFWVWRDFISKTPSQNYYMSNKWLIPRKHKPILDKFYRDNWLAKK